MALNITRRDGQSFMIGTDEEAIRRGECAKITILRKIGNNTHVAITAPDGLLILREELIKPKEK